MPAAAECLDGKQALEMSFDCNETSHSHCNDEYGWAFDARRVLGPWIAKRRTPKIQKQYAEIGGGSPIRKYTEAQGKMLAEYLDRFLPNSAPHKVYVAFRYASPLTEEALAEMKRDGVERAVAFSQFPQYSCTTTGSSLNELWKHVKSMDLADKIRWSVLDRWHSHSAFIDSLTQQVLKGLEQFDEAARKRVVLLFSAHSIPIYRVNDGDPYPQEVGATVGRVMEKLHSSGLDNPYALCWQSKVGPLPWLGPKTPDAMERLAKQGHRHFMAIPVAFTSDHVETLYEIDVEMAEEAKKLKVAFHRSPSFNDDPHFAQALGQIVKEHLEGGHVCSSQYGLNCHGCVSPAHCRLITNPIAPYQRLKDAAAAAK